MNSIVDLNMMPRNDICNFVSKDHLCRGKPFNGLTGFPAEIKFYFRYNQQPIVKKTKYYLAAITAYSIWGLFSLVLKPLDHYSSVDILFYRVFSCAILLLLFVALFKRQAVRDTIATFNSLPSAQKRRVILLNIAGSIFITGNWFSFIYVLNHISIHAASLAYLVCPVLTTLLAFIFLKEKLSRIQWISVAMSIAGCLLLSFASLLDLSFAVLVGFSYACYLVSQRMNTGFDKLIVLSVHIILSSMILLPFFPSYAGPAPTSPTFYYYIEIMAVVFTIIPLFLNLYALTGLDSSTTGMLLNINPIIGFTVATLVFNEPTTPLEVISYSIILLAVIVFNAHMLFKSKDPAPGSIGKAV